MLDINAQQALISAINSKLLELAKLKKEHQQTFAQLSAEIILLLQQLHDGTFAKNDHQPKQFYEPTDYTPYSPALKSNLANAIKNKNMIFTHVMHLVTLSAFKDEPNVHEIFKHIINMYRHLDINEQIKFARLMEANIEGAYLAENLNGNYVLKGEPELPIFLHTTNADLVDGFAGNILIAAKKERDNAAKEKAEKEKALHKLEVAGQVASEAQYDDSMDVISPITSDEEDKAQLAFEQAGEKLSKAESYVEDARRAKQSLFELPTTWVHAMTPMQRNAINDFYFKEEAALATKIYNEQKHKVDPLIKPVKEAEEKLAKITRIRASLPPGSDDSALVEETQKLIKELTIHKQAAAKALQVFSVVREAYDRIELIENAKSNKLKRSEDQKQLDHLNAARELENNGVVPSIAMAQLNLEVGNIKGNKEKIIKAIVDAAGKGIKTIIFPEMAITGYLPEDRLLQSDFIKDSDDALVEIIETIKASNLDITAYIGHPKKDKGKEPIFDETTKEVIDYKSVLFNATSIITFKADQTPIHQSHYKSKLAVDGLFKEARYFETEQDFDYLEIHDGIPQFLLKDEITLDGKRYNVQLRALATKLHQDGKRLPTITYLDGHLVWSRCCEEIWHNTEKAELDFVNFVKPKAVLVNNGSPYTQNKFEVRYNIVKDRVIETGLPHVYVNMGGTHVGVCYGGGSFIANPTHDDSGKITGVNFEHAAPHFQDGVFGVIVKPDGQDGLQFKAEKLYPSMIGDHYVAHRNKQALVTVIKEHFRKVGLKQASVGLSGGADSSLVLGLMVAALGPQNATAALLPSIYTSMISNVDAALECEQLGCRYDMVFIDGILDQIKKALKPFTDKTKGEWEVAAQKIKQDKLKENKTEEEADAAVADFLKWKQNIEKLAYENQGACVRQHDILHYISALLAAGNMATSNKAELITGYYTYKDTWGALSVIADAPKHVVYKMLAELAADGLVPARVVVRVPTAELAPGQADQDSLPPYPILDETIDLHEEDKLSQMDVALYMNHAWELREHYTCDLAMVNKVLWSNKINRFKSITGCPVATLSNSTMNTGLQEPVASGHDTFVTFEKLAQRMRELAKVIIDNQELANNDPNKALRSILIKNLEAALAVFNSLQDKSKLRATTQYPALPILTPEYQALAYHFEQLFEHVVQQKQNEYLNSPEGEQYANNREYTQHKLQKIREGLFRSCVKGKIDYRPAPGAVDRPQDTSAYLVQKESEFSPVVVSSSLLNNNNNNNANTRVMMLSSNASGFSRSSSNLFSFRDGQKSDQSLVDNVTGNKNPLDQGGNVDGNDKKKIRLTNTSNGNK